MTTCCPAPDLHIHTRYCGHAGGELDAYVLHAIQMGLPEIGFAGHFPYPDGFVETVPNCVIPARDFPLFVEEALRLQSRYKESIAIRLAAEIDFLPDFTEQIRSALTQWPLDYVIGSVHMLDGIPLSITIWRYLSPASRSWAARTGCGSVTGGRWRR